MHTNWMDKIGVSHKVYFLNPSLYQCVAFFIVDCMNLIQEVLYYPTCITVFHPSNEYLPSWRRDEAVPSGLRLFELTVSILGAGKTMVRDICTLGVAGNFHAGFTTRSVSYQVKGVYCCVIHTPPFQWCRSICSQSWLKRLTT